MAAWLPPVVFGLVVIASAAAVRVRVRSAVAVMTWTDAAIVVAIVGLPPAWVPLCVGLAVFVAKTLRQVEPAKAAYNAGKDALAATAGLALAIPLGVANIGDPLAHLLELLLVAVTVTAVQHLIGAPVLALAAGVRWTRILRTDADIKAASFVGKSLVAGLVLACWEVDQRLLAVVTPVALCLHLLYLGQVRARAERATWQRLASTTEELNSTDLDVVLSAAVVNAARLFAAVEVEIFLRDGPDGPFVVRGDSDGVRWRGDPGQAPPRSGDGDSVTARLAGFDLKADLGEIRLQYAGRVGLTDRERLTLRTFVSALRTAVRNAAAYAEARRLALRNAHAAQHDPLTGLANRHRVLSYGEAALARGARVALLFIDLDQFREVNEVLGHLAGDRLLTEVARRLTLVAAPEDLVARLGGDEFAVLLIGPEDSSAALVRARAVLGALDAPVDLGEMRVRVEASAGLAIAAEDAAASPEEAMVELLRRADVAMYQAKGGGGIVTYAVERDTADAALLMLGGDLPRAIAENQFAVVFQPIVDLATGDMISAEALARWRHPEHGDLNPRRFLAAVERSGMLPAFAGAVLDQALAAMVRWRALGIDAPVAVNASPRSLLDPSFPRLIRERLAAHGLEGSDLVVELTETLTMGQVEHIGAVLRDLCDAGVRLALDDFGTSSSSLAMLARVPATELKIDRSFVAQLGLSPQADVVVRSTVELGRGIGKVVVAEGVEREEQRAALRRMGCPAGQGHLFGRPMPADELLERLATGLDGVRGRLRSPMHAGAGNVIDLPAQRRPETSGQAPGVGSVGAIDREEDRDDG